MLKPIPEELKKQGVRWVSINGKNRILMLEFKNSHIIIKKHSEEAFFKENPFDILSTSTRFKEIPQPQEPKKIPYTAETFPENALWVRRNHYMKGVRESILDVYKDRIEFEDTNAYFEDISKKIKIGCQVIKDGEIKIEWKPFYQIKE